MINGPWLVSGSMSRRDPVCAAHMVFTESRFLTYCAFVWLNVWWDGFYANRSQSYLVLQGNSVDWHPYRWLDDNWVQVHIHGTIMAIKIPVMGRCNYRRPSQCAWALDTDLKQPLTSKHLLWSYWVRVTENNARQRVNLSVGSASQTARQSRLRGMELTGSSEGKPCRVSHWIEQQRRKWKEMKLPAQPEVPRV